MNLGQERDNARKVCGGDSCGKPRGVRESVFLPCSATFSNQSVERAYRDFLTDAASNRERLLQFIAITVFLSYGILDLLTVGSLATEFLILRFVFITPVVIVGVIITSLSRFRRHIQWSTTFGFAAFSAAIIYMIYRMPGEGSPPYIIGLLVVMIFTSCLMRINFLIAAPVYLFIACAYCAVLVAHESLPSSQIVAGSFFMISVAAVAVVTIYVQEIRSRADWLHNLERERDSAKIEQLLVEATAADRSKINFLSVLTHELRTPLHQIIGFSEVVRTEIATNDKTNVTEQLDRILASARDLLKKLGQMLRYADATAGKLEYFPDDIAIEEVIEQLSDQFHAVAHAKSIAIDSEHVTAATLRIDQHHTIYALSNLLENALNASTPGSAIHIEGERLGDDGYRLRIRDHGCGMAVEKIAAAMSPFEQIEPARSRNREGLGLGLTIAKRLLNEQQASLSIDSAVGVGTTATIEFARNRQPDTDEVQANVAAFVNRSA